MWQLKRSLMITAAVALIGSGCASAFRQPEVRFEGVRVGGLGLRGGTVYAQLHVLNPNGFDLETTSLTYDLELANGDTTRGGRGWARLAEGTFDDPIRVQGRDSAIVEIPIEFDYASMTGALRSILDRGTFDYRVSGVVAVRDPVRRNVPYRRTGTVSLAGVR